MASTFLPRFRGFFFIIWAYIWASLNPSQYRYAWLPCCKENWRQHDCTYIRLLRIVRVDDKRIECSLSDHELLQSNLRYHCLSYTWGDPFPPPKNPLPILPLPWYWRIFREDRQSPGYVVVCDGREIPISYNLWTALSCLREKCWPELDAIWIDQICINQRDGSKIEKNSQVSAMNHIYEGAESVVVWLGPERDPVENLSLVMDVGEELARLEREYELKDTTDVYRFDNFRAQLTGRFSIEHWASLHYFLCRSYFNRMWILQEVVVAKQLRIFCGNTKVLWKTVHNVS